MKTWGRVLRFMIVERLFLGRSHEFIDLLFDYEDKLYKMLLFLLVNYM